MEYTKGLSLRFEIWYPSFVLHKDYLSTAKGKGKVVPVLN
jgi:hypothetical protein